MDPNSIIVDRYARWEMDAANLEFVHIMKTGGSVIEKAAASVGITWGACHFTRHPLRREMRCPSDDLWSREKLRRGHGHRCGFRVPPWHRPPSVVPYYRRSETFTVKRDPLDRVLSLYHDRWRGPRRGMHETAAEMNAWIREQIRRCRFGAPQSAFEADTVLRFENLTMEFNEFMRDRGYPVRIAEHYNVRDRSLGRGFSVRDLDAATRSVVLRWSRDVRRW